MSTSMPITFGLSGRSACSRKTTTKGKGSHPRPKIKSKGQYKGKGKGKSRATTKPKRTVARRARARRAFSHSEGSASDATSLSDDFSDTDSKSSASSDSGSAHMHYETDHSERLVDDAEVVAILRAERAAAARSKQTQRSAAAGRRKERKHACPMGDRRTAYLASDDDMDEGTEGTLRSDPGRPDSPPSSSSKPKHKSADTVAAPPTQPSPPRSVATLTEQLFEVARIRDTVRADLSAEPWQMDMFEHVFTLFGNVLISVGGLHAQVDRLLACVKAQYRPPSTCPPTPMSGSPTASPLPVFAETVDEFNQITGRSVSRSVLWTDEEARADFARKTRVAALSHNTPVPFAHIVRDEDGEPVDAARLKTIRAVIREAVAELEALPDKRVPNQNGILPNMCRTYFQTYHRFAFLQMVRRIEANAPELGLCKNHYKTLNGVDRRFKSINSKDPRDLIDLTKDEDDDMDPAGAASSTPRPILRPTPRQIKRKPAPDDIAKRILSSGPVDGIPSTSRNAISVSASVAPGPSTARKPGSSAIARPSSSSITGSTSDLAIAATSAPLPANEVGYSAARLTGVASRTVSQSSSSTPAPSVPRMHLDSTTADVHAGRQRQLPSFASMFNVPDLPPYAASQPETLNPSSGIHSTYSHFMAPPPAPGSSLDLHSASQPNYYA
ncbi:hypothetical protein OC844_005952 [Tilletia horrida]|nr:hypothetical protein OC844_005952 [Tilletia horrida]